VLAAALAFGAWAAPRGRRRGWRPGETPPVRTGRDEAGDGDGGTFQWSLGRPPTLPHPDRAETEGYVRMLPGRAGGGSVARGRW
jgi:hypothetical protein